MNLPLLRRFRLHPATRTGEFDESLKIERHACYGTTLGTYSHLWPTAEDKTRAAAADIATAILESGSSALWSGSDRRTNRFD